MSPHVETLPQVRVGPNAAPLLSATVPCPAVLKDTMSSRESPLRLGPRPRGATSPAGQVAQKAVEISHVCGLPGFAFAPFIRTWKWMCSPVEHPAVPITPTCWPRATDCPLVTMNDERCVYSTCMPPPWSTSTQRP